MNKTSARFYIYLTSIVILFFSIELALEYRHHLLGYNTPIFGETSSSPPIPEHRTDIERKAIYGPTDSFPFRSKLLDNKKNGTRVWIASASHAVGGRIPANKIFPNLICDYLEATTNCETINGSQNGIGISKNIELLKEYSPNYLPDFAVLYQMSMFIADQQKILTTKGQNKPENNSIIDFSAAQSLFQSLSLYTHLSNLIGGSLELEGQLKDKLPASAQNSFHSLINQFIQTSLELGITPVLVTFATSHDITNIQEMPLKDKTNFVKWVSTPYLSPEGWIHSISELNLIIKDISLKQKVVLIDLNKSMNGQYKYFIDFVHFNETGHSEAAKIIGKELDRVLKRTTTNS